MLKRNLILLFSFSVITALQAQSTIPVNNNITIEILSPNLQISNEPQFLQTKILVQSAQPLQYLDLKLVQTEATWSVVSANLNGKPIWLVQSDTTVNNPDVLGWSFNKDDFTLRLQPAAWVMPYTLELEMQINLTNLKNMETITLDEVRALVQLPGGLYSCASSGRGVQINLQKLSE